MPEDQSLIIRVPAIVYYAVILSGRLGHFTGPAARDVRDKLPFPTEIATDGLRGDLNLCLVTE